MILKGGNLEDLMEGTTVYVNETQEAGGQSVRGVVHQVIKGVKGLQWLIVRPATGGTMRRIEAENIYLLKILEVPEEDS